MLALRYLLGAHEVLYGVGEMFLAHIGLAQTYQTVGLLSLAFGGADEGGRQHHRHGHEHGCKPGRQGGCGWAAGRCMGLCVHGGLKNTGVEIRTGV